MASDRYDVIEDWLEDHKALTKTKVRYEGVQTPPVARHRYLHDAGLYGGERNGKALYDFFAWVRDPAWPTAPRTGGKAELAFEARVRAGRFDLLREWRLVFDHRSHGLYSGQDRANVLLAVAMSARRIAECEHALAAA